MQCIFFKKELVKLSLSSDLKKKKIKDYLLFSKVVLENHVGLDPTTIGSFGSWMNHPLIMPKVPMGFVAQL